MHYYSTNDRALKARILRDLHYFPLHHLRKIRGGRTANRLNQQWRRSAAFSPLFTYLRPFDTPPAAASPPPAANVTHIYTDGSCALNSTGVGVVIMDPATSAITKTVSFYTGDGTNNSAELTAILVALDLFIDDPERHLTIYSDSEYAIGAATINRVVANAQLIFNIRQLISRRAVKPTFVWVRGHSTHAGNIEADRIAVAARQNRNPPILEGTTLHSSMPQELEIKYGLSSSSSSSAFSSSSSTSLSSSSSSSPSSSSSTSSASLAFPQHQRSFSSSSSSSSSSCSSQQHINLLSSSPSSSSSPSPSQRSINLLSSSSSSFSSSSAGAPRSFVRPIEIPDDYAFDGGGGGDENSLFDRQIYRAVSIARDGHLRRAIQSLDRPPLPAITRSSIQHLHELHPIRSSLDSSSIIPNDIDLQQYPGPVVEGETLLKVIRAANNGSAAGPTQLSMDLITALANDAECLKGLVAIIQDIVNGNVDPSVISLITAAVSVAIPKPGGSGVRPLAIPESLYKLASLIGLNSIQPAMPLLFPSIQYGCGIKGGVEIALHRAQLAVETGGSDVVVLRTDFKNAFNIRHRRIIAARLFSSPSTSTIWRFFALAYGGTEGSAMGVYQRGKLIHHFLNNEGVKQGDPLAAFLFALSMQPVYEECVRGIEGVEAVAIADDFTLIGPAKKVVVALERLIALCDEDDGLILNLLKCEVLWVHASNHPSYSSFVEVMNRHHINIRHDCVALLGSSIGVGMKRQTHVLQSIGTHDQLFRAILHPAMPSQIGLLLLRISALPRLNYLLRVTPPIIIRAAAERFDELIINTAIVKSGLPSPSTNPSTLVILRSPLLYDGLGFRPHTLTSPAAYWSSVASAASHLRRHRSPSEMAVFIRETDTHFHLGDTYLCLVRSGVNPEITAHLKKFPAAFDLFWSFYSSNVSEPIPHLQHHLTSYLDRHSFINHPPLAPTVNLNRFKNTDRSIDVKSQLSTTTSWLTTTPTKTFSNLSSPLFNAALRHRYNLPAADNLPSRCKCNTELATYPSHFHSCNFTRRTSVLNRHQCLVMCIAHYARSVGLIVHVEPPQRDNQQKRTIPDFSFTTTADSIHYQSDVSVCSSYALTNANNNTDPIILREKQKIVKYHQAACDNDSTFIPFVMDSLGRFGAGAMQLIEVIINHYSTYNPHDSISSINNLRSSIITSLSFQLQAGNGGVDVAAVNKLIPRKPIHHPSLLLPAVVPHPIRHDTLVRPPAHHHHMPSSSFASSSSSLSALAASLSADEAKRSGASSSGSSYSGDSSSSSGSGQGESKEGKVEGAHLLSSSFYPSPSSFSASNGRRPNHGGVSSSDSSCGGGDSSGDVGGVSGGGEGKEEKKEEESISKTATTARINEASQESSNQNINLAHPTTSNRPPSSSFPLSSSPPLSSSSTFPLLRHFDHLTFVPSALIASAIRPP